MATEKQLAANRRNARKSTGPRSLRGKQRASQNSYRHGFGHMAGNHDPEAVEELARKFVGVGADLIRWETARTAAEAELTLRQISQARNNLINRILNFGEFEIREVTLPRMATKDLWRLLEICFYSETFPKPPDATVTMPVSLSDRTAESIRRALPALKTLDRYTLRAAGRRDAAVRRLLVERT